MFAANIATNDIAISQGPYYELVQTITGPSGSEFGYDLASSRDGAQLGVGVPNATVNGRLGAGAVYVYDRVIEAFVADGGQDFVTSHTINNVHRVVIDDVEVSNYFVVGSNTIRFVTPPESGKVIYVETNQFNLLELLTGSVAQSGARFGTSLTICFDNCAIYVGAPYYDNGGVYNTGAVFKFHNRGRLYGTNLGEIQNPTFTKDDTIRLDNFEVIAANISTPASSVVSLDDLVDNINSTNILGVSATNENGYLRLNSDQTIARDLLRMLSGSGTIWSDAGMAVFAEMQIIINPYNTPGEYFGSKVVLAPNAYMLVISSNRGTTKEYTVFDADTTTLDHTTTNVFDVVKNSGSVYIYELYDDPRDAYEHPGRYAFAQQLNPGDLNTGDQFGTDIDIVGGYILVSAPADDTVAENAGSVYLFENPKRTRGWNLLRYQQPKVDIDSINRIYLYNNLTNTILTNLEFIDPAKGKILGQAEQEISYKTAYDPAVYNRGSNSSVSINSNLYWNESHVGKVWWNLDMVRFVDYEQDTVSYRSINWGQLFPGSVVEVLEWVESTVLPSQYVDAGYDGVPKHADNSAYVQISFVDQTTNTITNRFYFWVTGKTTLDPNDETRNLPIQAVQDLIENPKSQGIAYAAIVQDNALLVYNVKDYLSAQNTVLHLDYELVKNTSIIHSEYELVQKGNADSFVPTKISNKLIDSLSGIDANGAVVPDPKLSLADRYGLGYRPRQGMFVDRLSAMNDFVAYVNSVLIPQPIAREYDLNQLNSQEPLLNIKFDEYDLAVSTDTDLLYIDTGGLSTGYRVLVETDTTQDGLWVLYTLTEEKTWLITRVQSYKTNLYWSRVDWYAPGHSPADQIDYAVDTYVDALKLNVATGSEILVKVNTTDHGWNLLIVDANKNFSVVGIQNGTIQLNTSLGDYAGNELGFGNQGFSTKRYDQNPNIEIRSIILA